MQLLFLLIPALALLMAIQSSPKSNDDPDNCLDNVEIPKKFTPNYDGENDYFEIKFPCTPEDFEIHIKDYTGKEVFTTNIHIFQWGGFDEEGEKCESGVYSWEVKYNFHLKMYDRNGQVLLLR